MCFGSQVSAPFLADSFRKLVGRRAEFASEGAGKRVANFGFTALVKNTKGAATGAGLTGLIVVEMFAVVISGPAAHASARSLLSRTAVGAAARTVHRFGRTYTEQIPRSVPHLREQLSRFVRFEMMQSSKESQ